MSFSFEIIKQSKNTKARLGILNTPHGQIETPVFMPVGTLGSVKAVLPEMLLAEGTQIILANTYHLFLRPGIQVIEKMNGLHSFMNWHKPILTDSGGFQVFSLGKLNKITANGVSFRSHLDGTEFELTPEKVVDIQKAIGSDIMMPLDECLPADSSKAITAESILRTYIWEKRAQEHFSAVCDSTRQALFGIIQGGMYPDLRTQSAEQLISCNFSGYAIGGLSVGEDLEVMYNLIEHTAKILPQNKPRYLMGVGSPAEIRYAVSQGIDMFDCVLPTRLARHGAFYCGDKTLNIKKKDFEFDASPLSPECTCHTCLNYSRSYLRHLWRNKEFNALTLMSIHNISYLQQLMRDIKRDIC